MALGCAGMSASYFLVDADVKTVEVGFRDDDGIIRSQRTFQTTSIPRL